MIFKKIMVAPPRAPIDAFIYVKKELKIHLKGTLIFARYLKKSHKSSAVRSTCVLVTSTISRVNETQHRFCCLCLISAINFLSRSA